jgi:hypothetical protein
MQWFDVDKAGLAKLLERKGKQFIVHELIQNAWDEKTKRVDVRIKRIPGSPYVSLTVSDDNPDGFADLSHAFTLFAESNKKGNAEKRGRFNLGEKLVLALCRKASIRSTTGAVYFDEDGRRRGRDTTETGSIFYGELKMTDEEMHDCRKAMSLLIPPVGVQTSFWIDGSTTEILNDFPIEAQFEESLPTEIADAEGNMRRTQRKTVVTLHSTYGRQACLYEMGIPVVEIDGPFHVNVHQKVPLTFERDNVTPSYLARIHALTVEHMKYRLTAEEVNEHWVKIAIQEQGDDLSDETILRIADLRFGKNRVSFDPSDQEANNIAVTKGYQVIHGGSMSKAEWDVMRRAGAILPAGKVTPSRPDTTIPRITIPESEWKFGERLVAQLCRRLAPYLIGINDLKVQIFNNPTVSAIATYGSRTISFNVGRLGEEWFEGPLEVINTLIIHEFAHEKSGNHLSEAYYDALTEIGAKMTTVALERPEIFHPFIKRRPNV